MASFLANLWPSSAATVVPPATQTDTALAASVKTLQSHLAELSAVLGSVSQKASGALTNKANAAELLELRKEFFAKCVATDKAMGVTHDRVLERATEIRVAKATVPRDAKIVLLSDKEWVAVATATAPPNNKFYPPTAGTMDYEIQQLFWSLYKQFPLEGIEVDPSASTTWGLAPFPEWTANAEPMPGLDIVNEGRKWLATISPKINGFKFETAGGKIRVALSMPNVYTSRWRCILEDGIGNCADVPVSPVYTPKGVLDD